MALRPAKSHTRHSIKEFKTLPEYYFTCRGCDLEVDGSVMTEKLQRLVRPTTTKDVKKFDQVEPVTA